MPHRLPPWPRPAPPPHRPGAPGPAPAEAYWQGFANHVYYAEYSGLEHPAECDEPADLTRDVQTVGRVACWYNQDVFWVPWFTAVRLHLRSGPPPPQDSAPRLSADL